jgi:Ser/Thr protein kinase RdoA (MazF antagonist)
MLRRYWGVSGGLTRQRTEKDDTFVVAGEPQLLLKIVNDNERGVVTDAQVKALKHLERVHPRLPVPVVRPTLSGDLVAEDRLDEGSGRRAVLLSYLPGQPMPGNGERVASRGLLDNIGKSLGLLTNGLSSFQHPGSIRPDLVWDLRRLPEMSPLLELIDDDNQKMLVEDCLTDVTPILQMISKRPGQVCHNDFHPGNLLIGKPDSVELSGILDFGDMLFTQPICDLATCLTYFVMETSPALDAAKIVLNGYESIRSVSHEERAVLVELMRARLALTLLIPRWKAALRPRESDYELRKISHHTRLLARLSQMSPRQRATALRN